MVDEGEECINTLRCGSPRDLDLSHRSLYDDGCEVLFSWLKTGGVPSEGALLPFAYSGVYSLPYSSVPALIFHRHPE